LCTSCIKLVLLKIEYGLIQDYETRSQFGNYSLEYSFRIIYFQRLIQAASKVLHQQYKKRDQTRIFLNILRIVFLKFHCLSFNRERVSWKCTTTGSGKNLWRLCDEKDGRASILTPRPGPNFFVNVLPSQR
jgi:hypothetical protein